MTSLDIRADPSGPNFVRRLGDLRSQRLGDGAMTVKDIWAETGARAELLWMLRLIEFRGATGKLHSPPGTSQLVVGLSGPQVRMGSRGGMPLRRERSLTEATEVIELHRPAVPRVRHVGASLLLNLAFRRDLILPAFTFQRVSGRVRLGPDIRAIIILEGELEYPGSKVGAQSAIVLGGAEPGDFDASDARLLLLRMEEQTRTAAMPSGGISL